MQETLANAEKAIDKIMGTISQSNAFADPALLSQLMVRLAYSNHIVGRGLAGLQAAYRKRRKEVFDQFIQAGEKVTRAKEEGEAAARDEEEQYDHFYNLHEDTQTFISVCQSHLKMLAMEAKSQL